MITRAHMKHGFKFMVDDFEYTVHKIDSDVMFLTIRLHYEGRVREMPERPNINLHADHIEIWQMAGTIILKGRFYYSVMEPIQKTIEV